MPLSCDWQDEEEEEEQWWGLLEVEVLQEGEVSYVKKIIMQEEEEAREITKDFNA